VAVIPPASNSLKAGRALVTITNSFETPGSMVTSSCCPKPSKIVTGQSRWYSTLTPIYPAAFTPATGQPESRAGCGEPSPELLKVHACHS
jgi:hypothetical protein